MNNDLINFIDEFKTSVLAHQEQKLKGIINQELKRIEARNSRKLSEINRKEKVLDEKMERLEAIYDKIKEDLGELQEIENRIKILEQSYDSSFNKEEMLDYILEKLN
jgi:uncharacterized protein involved in exopolysaccharide biosynthesis